MLIRLKEIRELLVLKEWTREQLAKNLGITRNTVDRWFCVADGNRRYPSPDHAAKMHSWLAQARDENRSPQLVAIP